MTITLIDGILVAGHGTYVSAEAMSAGGPGGNPGSFDARDSGLV